MSPSSPSGTGYHMALLIVLGAIWSSSFLFIKIGVESLSPMAIATGRVVIAAALLFLYMKACGERLPPWGRSCGRAWGWIFFVGLFGNGVPFTLLGWGEERIDSGMAAILMAIMPLSTLLLSHVFTTDERLTWPRAAGVSFGLAGVVVLVGPEALLKLGDDAWRQLAVAGAAFCYASAAVAARRLPNTSPVSRGAAVQICASLQMLPVVLLIDKPWTMEPTAGALLSVLYLGLFPTALATIMLFYLLSLRGATYIALNNYLIPVLGVFWGALFLDELVTLRSLIALALILAGIVIASLKSKPLIAQP
ncbi:MAG: EamA family transporter [Rhodospirillales bacterium]